VYFYELHEGDGDLFSDLLLAHEDEMSADLFFELVQDVRRRIQDSYSQDTLIEAIAEVLEREHDFLFVSDDRLTASANVSSIEDENFLVGIDEELGKAGDGTFDDRLDDPDDEDDEADLGSGPFRTLVVDLDVDGASSRN
jgi:hypothetical protein